MSRPKKENNIHLDSEEKQEVIMSNVNAPAASEDLESLESEMDRVRVELQKTKLELEEKKNELTNFPRRDISEKEKELSQKQVAGFVKNESLKAKIEEQKKRDSEQVTGKFSNLRAPGQGVKLPYHKYADDPVKWWTFEHGQVYTIPRGFADQINGEDPNCPCYYTPQFIKNENAIANPDDPGTGIHHIDTSNKKYMFSPINF